MEMEYLIKQPTGPSSILALHEKVAAISWEKTSSSFQHPKQTHLLSVAQIFSEVALSAWGSFVEGSLRLKAKDIHWGATTVEP